MSAAALQLEAGGLLLAGAKVDEGATEQVVARQYAHKALGTRVVVRLASERLGQAEDLAMEFLGFDKPEVSAPVALQQRRSLGFAAWALTNDPANARYALDLVKRMKAAARQARAKPGHAWDAYLEMAKDLGRSARHFLPPFWEEAGRTFKDLGNPSYAGRALTKSLEAERVHALESDRARRRDVILEFVLSGCLAGSALSDYAGDLENHYAPAEAYAIFRDLCVRRTRGGMAPWANMPKEFTKLAQAAGLDGDQELEKWLEEVIDAPAMARPPLQFWKACSSHCQRIVARHPAFAVALLRHTRPEPRHYGESKLGPWLELLEQWGVFDFLWQAEHRGAPPLGEPSAVWFGRIVRDDVPAPARVLDMLEKLAPRLRQEKTPLPLSITQRHGGTPIDVDVLEACLALGVKVDDPPPRYTISFTGWLAASPDHPRRNQDLVAAPQDERFATALRRGLHEALSCRGGSLQRGYRQGSIEQHPFPLAAAERPGIKELWRRHTADVIARLEQSGLASFAMLRARLEATLWPDTLRLFPDLADRLQQFDAVAMLQRTLQAGLIDEYGLPALDAAVDRGDVAIESKNYGDTNVHWNFPSIVVTDAVHAHVFASDGSVKKLELRLPKKSRLNGLIVAGDDVAVIYSDEKYQAHFHWLSNPAQVYDTQHYRAGPNHKTTVLEDGSVFLGQQCVRPGDKQMPQTHNYFHDGKRFWRVASSWDPTTGLTRWRAHEVEPRTGEQGRESVPPWFEENEGGELHLGASLLVPAPPGSADSPLGSKDGMLGWKVVKRGDGSYVGMGIDGRRWDKPLIDEEGHLDIPVGLLRQAGTDRYLPVTFSDALRRGGYGLWDPSGVTMVAHFGGRPCPYARGQVVQLWLEYWHLLKPRDEASSRKLRSITLEQCQALLDAAAEDRQQPGARRAGKDAAENPLPKLRAAVEKLLPTAPERLALGIARLVEHAGRESADFAALRERSRADAHKGASASALVINRRIDEAAGHWGLPSFHIYGNEGSASLSAHLAAAAAFLKGDTPGGDLPRTGALWFELLEDLPLRCWQTHWRARAARLEQKDDSEVPWLELLTLWRDLGIAELPGQFDVMDAVPQGAKKNAWGGYDIEVNGGIAYTLQNGSDRFIVIENDRYHHSKHPYEVLRYSTGKTPAAPPGFQASNVRRLKTKYDAAEVSAFIDAAGSCTAPPLPTRAELDEVAATVGASAAEVGLVWLGGLNVQSHQHNFLPAELRTGLGCKAAEASAARQALRNLNAAVLEQLYQAVVSQGMAAPFRAERGPVLRALEKTWQKKMSKRSHIDAALQKRLLMLGRLSRWHRINHEELLAVAADPGKHPLLQPREVDIKVNDERGYASLELRAGKDKERFILADSLRTVAQTVAVVHAETPAGHPARADMPPLIKQTTRMLDHSGTLLELRHVHIYPQGKKKVPTPGEWVSQHVGKTKANAKDATARCDDGLLVAAALDKGHSALVAFRPAKLKSDSDLARLKAISTGDSGEGNTIGADLLPIVLLIKGPGFQKLASAIVTKDVPEGQWPQDARHTAPAVIKAIQKKHKLSADAALLYAQVLALPDPTTANVCAWNGWNTAQLKQAAAELVGKKLVLEATRARAGRSIFLPGEWSELKAPWLPIEAWKLAHLTEVDLKTGDPCPGGGPLVLRPFADVFAAAWQRVEQGDVPRYEEVKRKKKAK